MNQFITEEIGRFVATYSETRSLLTRWGDPLVGFADAKDSLFSRLKQAVGPSHPMPSDLLEDAETVIVYFLPFDKNVARSNRRNYYASREWAVAYIETNRLIVDINQHLADILDAKGFETFMLPPTHNFDEEQLISDWSHKHMAFIAGLGRFGTHHLLITEKGCCGRLGSLITNAFIEASGRPDTEYCLRKYNKTCGVCVRKCVTSALKADTFDRHECYRILLENAEIHQSEGLADVCGKCISVVPCSFHNPVKKAVKKK